MGYYWQPSPASSYITFISCISSSSQFDSTTKQTKLHKMQHFLTACFPQLLAGIKTGCCPTIAVCTAVDKHWTDNADLKPTQKNSGWPCQPWAELHSCTEPGESTHKTHLASGFPVISHPQGMWICQVLWGAWDCAKERDCAGITAWELINTLSAGLSNFTGKNRQIFCFTLYTPHLKGSTHLWGPALKKDS